MIHIFTRRRAQPSTNKSLTINNNLGVISIPVYSDQPISSKSPPTRDKLQPENKAQVRGRIRETDTTGYYEFLFLFLLFELFSNYDSKSIHNAGERALSFSINSSGITRGHINFEIPKYFHFNFVFAAAAAAASHF